MRTFLTAGGHRLFDRKKEGLRLFRGGGGSKKRTFSRGDTDFLTEKWGVGTKTSFSR